MKFMIICGTAFIFTAVGIILYYVCRTNFELDIFYVNDLQGFLDGYKTNCKEQPDNCTGGINEMIKAYKHRRTSGHSILLNAGNNFGSTDNFDLTRSAEMLKELPFDAFTIGSGDFHQGVENLTKFMEGLSPVPFVACNVNSRQESKTKNFLHKSVVVEREGKKIGIIGVISSIDFNDTNHGNLTFTTNLHCVLEEASRLNKNENVFTNILLSQCGYQRDLILAQLVLGLRVSVIVGSNNNKVRYEKPHGMKFPKPKHLTEVVQVNNEVVLVVNTKGHGQYLGHLKVYLNKYGKPMHGWKEHVIFLNKTDYHDEYL